MTPEPAPRPTREGVGANHRDVRGLSSEFADVHGGAIGRIGQRAKPPSPGCSREAYASKGGNKVALPPPMPNAHGLDSEAECTPAA